MLTGHRIVMVAACIVTASCTAGDGSGSGSTSVGDTATSNEATASADGSTSGATGADVGDPADPYPDPGDWPPNSGPGGPAVAFAPDDLYVNCAFLDGGAMDVDHHNLVVMFDGYLLMPWAPEFSTGGITFFDVGDPCNPVQVGAGTSNTMRESHSVGIVELHDRWWAVVADKNPGLLSGDGGIQFWDITDPGRPLQLSRLELPGHNYPDAYERVTLSVFWQGPYVYAAASLNGIFVIDASDPMKPEIVQNYNVEPAMRFGQLQVVGNLLITMAAEGPRTVLVDASVPNLLQPLPGGDFSIVDGDGVSREAYFSNIGGGYVYYAIKNNAGGLLVYDIHDPSAPVYAGNLDTGGNGGYVFVKDDLAFVGESDFAGIYDLSGMPDIQPVAQLDLVGDLDTATPVGNVVVLSVDDDGMDGQASAVAPWREAVDAEPPFVTWSVPDDGATDMAITSRVGVTFNEMVDVKSAWAGSVRLYRSDMDPALGRVDGIASVQENVVNFAPDAPLLPGTAYTFEIPAGGIVDYNGNPVAEPFVLEFTTAGG